VVIPARDGALTLPPLLESLQRQTLGEGLYEVLVVDNGSRDDTATVARSHGARVIEEAKPNRAGARNAGVRAAHADLIAYTDADCVADPGWLEAMRDALGEHEIVAGHVSVTTGRPPNAVERFEALWRFNQEQWINDGWAATANLGVRRSVHDEIGGFDTAYRHIAEDADYCLRAGRRGHALAFAPGAVIDHYAEDELWPMLRRAFFHGYSANQASHRLGVGERTWRHPGLILSGDHALAALGVRRESRSPGEWRTLRRLARGYYLMRVLGSGWAELTRAR
jgi:glycosyltransferase involved in cell wall biosynthesis